MQTDFQGLESNRDEQWGMLTGVVVELTRLKEEVMRLSADVEKRVVGIPAEKRREIVKVDAGAGNEVLARRSANRGEGVRAIQMEIREEAGKVSAEAEKKALASVWEEKQVVVEKFREEVAYRVTTWQNDNQIQASRNL